MPLARSPSRPGEESECGNRHDREGWRCGGGPTARCCTV